MTGLWEGRLGPQPAQGAGASRGNLSRRTSTHLAASTRAGSARHEQYLILQICEESHFLCDIGMLLYSRYNGKLNSFEKSQIDGIYVSTYSTKYIFYSEYD